LGRFARPPITAANLGGPAAFVGPTAGYLLAFPLAAFVAGWLSRRGVRFQALWRVAGGLAAMVVIYAGGAAWLSGYVGGLPQAWALGVVPFASADALKVVIASALLSLHRR
jgi:biotin transport system substrate-specific component